MITMTDIAARAGVSRSAVSLALNDNNTVRIPQATRQRIIETALEMGYRTNQLARSAASGKSKMVGYPVSEPDYEPYWNTLVSALTEAEELGFTLKVLSVSDLREKLRRFHAQPSRISDPNEFRGPPIHRASSDT